MRKILGTLGALASLAAVACTGGAGAVSGADGWDERPGNREAPSSGLDVDEATSDREPPRGAASVGPGSGSGTASFACTGRYVCSVVLSGQVETEVVDARMINGVCTLDEIPLQSDGTLRGPNGEVGTWRVAGTALILTSQGLTLTCIPSPDPDGSGGDTVVDPAPQPEPAPTPEMLDAGSSTGN